MAASSSKPKPPQLTHFLCIPLVTRTSRPQLAGTLTAFQEDVTRPKSLGGFDLPADAVRPVGTLHFTLGMMSFPKGKEGDGGLEKAINVLQSLNLREILAGAKKKPVVMPGAETETKAGEEKESSQILVTLKGLHSMQKPEKATVLYTPPVDPVGTLQEFSERMTAVFKAEGLLVEENRPLLLHATIVNTTYSKEKVKNRKGKWDRKVVSDASGIINRYEDEIWMEDVPLERVAICKMGAKPVLGDGQVVDVVYEEEAAVPF